MFVAITSPYYIPYKQNLVHRCKIPLPTYQYKNYEFVNNNKQQKLVVHVCSKTFVQYHHMFANTMKSTKVQTLGAYHSTAN